VTWEAAKNPELTKSLRNRGGLSSSEVRTPPPLASPFLKESCMNHEDGSSLGPGGETKPSIIDALALRGPLHRVAVWMLDQINSAQSIILLSFSHGRADGYVRGLEVTQTAEPAVCCYLYSIYKNAHDRRLIQLFADGGQVGQGQMRQQLLAAPKSPQSPDGVIAAPQNHQ
jgi:hypothetical protein